MYASVLLKVWRQCRHLWSQVKALWALGISVSMCVEATVVIVHLFCLRSGACLMLFDMYVILLILWNLSFPRQFFVWTTFVMWCLRIGSQWTSSGGSSGRCLRVLLSSLLRCGPKRMSKHMDCTILRMEAPELLIQHIGEHTKPHQHKSRLTSVGAVSFSEMLRQGWHISCLYKKLWDDFKP